MISPKICVLFGALTLACAATTADAQQTAVTPEWAGGELNWSGPSRTLIRWAPVLSNGQVLICGAYANLGGSKITRLSRVVMGDAKVRDAAGQIVLNNASFFRIVSSAHYQTRLDGQMANCQAANVPATQEAMSGLRLDIQPGRVRTP